MQENNFEKQVQEKMDELAINPSAEVWQKLTVTIAKDKNNRKMFIILAVLFLLISTTIYFILKSGDKKIDIAVAEKGRAGETNGIIDSATDNRGILTGAKTNRPAVTNKYSTGNHIENAVDATDSSVGQQGAGAVSGNKVAFVKLNKPGVENTIVKNNSNTLVINKAKKTKNTARQKLNVAIVQSNPEDLDNDKSQLVNANKLNDGVEVNEVKEKTETAEIVKLPVDAAVISTTDLQAKTKDTVFGKNTADNVVKATVKRSSKSREKSGWKLGFSFSIGASTTKNGLLGVIGSGGGDGSKSYDPLQNSSGGLNNGANSGYNPSSIKAGTAIAAGVFIQKSISAKANLLIGLNFKSLSSSMLTGSRVDSSAFYSSNSFRLSDFYYRNGTQVKYKNHFSFIELPVGFRVQLGKAKKLPVYLNTGISIAQLIGSNALQFDAATGNYFQDNHLLNKTQFGISAGLLFSVTKNLSYPFLLGPDINFSLNKMAASGLYKSRHYSYIGILLQKTLSKK
jgi:hypothetical protein